MTGFGRRAVAAARRLHMEALACREIIICIYHHSLWFNRSHVSGLQ